MGKANTQNGNVLWFILIAIALLGLLTSMLNRSGGNTNETGDYEQQTIKATEILRYASSIENGVQSLLARGCGENNLSFWHDSNNNNTEDAGDDYYNADAPTDQSCHVFEAEGAGITRIAQDPSEMGWLTTEDYTWPSDQIFFHAKPIKGVGRDDYYDLIMWVSSMDRELCLQINNLSDITNPAGEAPRDAANPIIEGGGWAGSFPLINEWYNIETVGDETLGKKSGCVVSDEHAGASSAYNGDDRYYFYYVLHTR